MSAPILVKQSILLLQLLYDGISAVLLEPQLSQLPLERGELSGRNYLSWTLAGFDLSVAGDFWAVCFDYIISFLTPENLSEEESHGIYLW